MALDHTQQTTGRSPETHKLELCLQPCDEPKGPQTHFRFFAKILVLFAPVILVAAPDCLRTVFGDEALMHGALRSRRSSRTVACPGPWKCGERPTYAGRLRPRLARASSPGSSDSKTSRARPPAAGSRRRRRSRPDVGAPEEDEVDEDPVEAVVAVDEGQVETPAFAEESGQRGLRSLRVVLYHLRDPRLLQELQTEVREPLRLVGVEGDVSRRRVRVTEQTLANVERRDAVAEADLDRLRRPFA